MRILCTTLLTLGSLVMTSAELSHAADTRLSRVYHEAGKRHLEKMNYSTAIDEFTKAIQYNPRSYWSHLYRGLCRQHKGDYETALKDYTRAISINPRLYDAYRNRGYIYSLRGEYNRAIRDYDSAIRVSPYTASLYNSRGIVWKRKGDYQKAIKDYTKALTTYSPRYIDAFAFNNRAYVFLQQQHFEKAVSDLSEAFKIDPTRIRYLRREKALIAWRKDVEKRCFQHNSNPPGGDAVQIRRYNSVATKSNLELNRLRESWSEHRSDVSKVRRIKKKR